MNRIICGNAVTELKKFDDNSVDLILTSPPYIGQREYKTNSVEEIGHEENTTMYNIVLGEVFSHCFRICKPTGSIVFNIGDSYNDKSLQLVPYRFAINILDHYHHTDLKLVNEITWVKTNPTPRQYKRRLISSKEPFFHFAKTDKYYYNSDAYLEGEKNRPRKNITSKKGEKYKELIEKSDLTDLEITKASVGLLMALTELEEGKITDFRMKIRGVHKKAFGGQAGGRNNQIEKQGFTIIRMYGNKLKRDIIETSVANTRGIDHPAVFPLKVIAELVKLLSKEGDIILDPFCGSGQVCLTAKTTNRQYIGIDLNEDYCELAKKRISKVESIR